MIEQVRLRSRVNCLVVLFLMPLSVRQTIGRVIRSIC